MKNILYILFLIPLLSFGQGTITLTDSDIKAFPGAIGHGQNTNGFRGRSVYFVTNTNNLGAGSFRQALADASAAGGGYIIFRTGGNLSFANSIYIGHSQGDTGNVYVAGQTAPGGGFGIQQDGTSSGQAMWIRGSEIVLRHIRSYGGQYQTSRGIGVGDTGSGGSTTLDYTMENIVIDHCSFSWGGDENVTFITKNSGETVDANGWLQKVSFTNNIIGEQNFSSYGLIMYGEHQKDFSLIGNYFSNHSDRDIETNCSGNEYEFLNNLIHYGGQWGAFAAAPKQKGNIIGNVYNPNVVATNGTIRANVCSTANCPPSGDSNFTGSSWWWADNKDLGRVDDNATYDTEMNTYKAADVIASVQSSNYTVLSSTVVPDSVLTNAGAGVGTAQGRDALDAIQIADYPSQGRYTQSLSGTPPTLATGTAYTDTDSDGLSDDYETDQGGSTTSISANARPATAVIGNGDTVDQSGVTSYASQGYTHLDIFLADLAGDWDSFASAPGGGPPAQGDESILKPHRVRFSNSTGAVYFGTTKIKG